jgi:hypothetical protein
MWWMLISPERSQIGLAAVDNTYKCAAVATRGKAANAPSAQEPITERARHLLIRLDSALYQTAYG